MIERAAKAIRSVVPQGYGMTDIEATQYARVVIMTLRAAGGEMAEAGADAVNPYTSTIEGFSHNVEVALDVWQAMIDEALN